MKKLTIIFAILLFCVYSVALYAQKSMFDERIEIGNGFYKVKSNHRWGIVDKNDNLKLSIEYNEPLFLNGTAVLTKYNSEVIEGIVDSIGNFQALPPYYVDSAYPFVMDGMLAVREEPNGDWGFLNTYTGELLVVDLKGFKLPKNNVLKKMGINGKGVKGAFVFDFVAPFVEGMAVVHTVKTGWHHIDKEGRERLKNPNMKPTMLRTSLHNGEAVVFDDRGIVLCMEDPSGNAGVKKYIAEDYEIKDYSKDLVSPYMINTNKSKLSLNNIFQADKYENATTSDSVIFIARPQIVKKVEVAPTDSFTLNRDINVDLSKESVAANANGKATITVNFSNIGEFDSSELSISVNIQGTMKSWEGIINIGSTQKLTLYVPAKFSAASISREVEWTVRTGMQQISGSERVTIKRYKPSRR